MMVRTRSGVARSGFTLVEMLAATIVLSLLIFVTLQMTRSSLRESRQANQLREQYPSTDVLVEQLTRDIRNAQGFSSSRNALSLFGPLGRDRKTGIGNQSLARVSYEVRNIAGRSALIRREVAQGSRPVAEVAWVGVGAFYVAGSEQSASVPNPLVDGGLEPPPTQLRIVMTNAEGRPVLSRFIRHHEEN